MKSEAAVIVKPAATWPWLALMLAAVCFAGSDFTLAQEAGEPSPADSVITNAASFWKVQAPEKFRPHRLKAQFLIYYFDPGWKVAFGEFGGEATFLPLGGGPSTIEAGRRLELDGWAVPGEQKVLWDRTAVRVLEESVELKPLSTKDRLRDFGQLSTRFVEVEGLVDGIERVDDWHINVHVVAEGLRALVVVRQARTNTATPWEESFIRLKGVYADNKDVNQQFAGLTLWVNRPADVQVLGALAEDPRFAPPPLRAEKFSAAPQNHRVLVQGTVRAQEPGHSVTIWDGSGQVRIESVQTKRLRIGDAIEAIGLPGMEGIEAWLHQGIYRLRQTKNGPDLAEAGPRVLRLAEEVREMSRDEADRGLPVKLQGVVCWGQRGTDFIFIADGSAGVRVVNPQFRNSRRARPRMMVQVEGITRAGDFAPVITNAVVTSMGTVDLPNAQSVSLEQALTGVEDGRWVEMQGYVREVREEKSLTRLEVSAWGGEFTVRVAGPAKLETLRGSIVRVRGVCSALADARRQLVGIEVWVPFPEDIQVEQGAPADPFALPLRPISTLRQFNAFNAVNQRVRTKGTVLLHQVGRYLYVQDQNSSVFVLSRQGEPLRPGDTVDVVGMPGNVGRKFLLREASYRLVAQGTEPAPIPLQPAKAVNLDLAGLLVRSQGTVLELANSEEGTKLVIQSGNSVVEGQWAGHATADQLSALPAGSTVAVTGVYDVHFDEYGRPVAPILLLRSWQDVSLLRRPPWWTLARLGWVLLGLLALCLTTLVWGVIISHTNRLLRQARSELNASKDQLELRVEERTRELANTHRQLVVASRQAGMAEVATGILHNVGNVLNSVNVSAHLLSDALRASRLPNLTKAVALLQQGGEDLCGFLQDDPKGRQLPAYLGELTGALREDQQHLVREVESLRKNIDHINVIIAMQQGYAKAGGLIEPVGPAELMEDAIQINRVAFERDQIQLDRQYRPVPRALLDRHQVLQILVNLLSNARHALEQTAPGERRVIVSIFTSGTEQVCLSVQDNGMGIPPENLERIFAQGFTTRKSGHGFGLHSGANAARQMKGALKVRSDGPGRGATFTLELPAARAEHVQADRLEAGQTIPATSLS